MLVKRHLFITHLYSSIFILNFRAAILVTPTEEDLYYRKRYRPTINAPCCSFNCFFSLYYSYKWVIPFSYFTGPSKTSSPPTNTMSKTIDKDPGNFLFLMWIYRGPLAKSFFAIKTT